MRSGLNVDSFLLDTVLSPFFPFFVHTFFAVIPKMTKQQGCSLNSTGHVLFFDVESSFVNFFLEFIVCSVSSLIIRDLLTYSHFDSSLINDINCSV